LPTKQRTKAPEPPLAKYQEKEPTQLHVDFVEWCAEKTGIEPDLKSVQLAFSLRHEFQVSPENQSNIARLKEEREQAAIDREERREARAAKAQERAVNLEAAKEERARKAAEKKAAKAATATAVTGGKRTTAKTAAKKTAAAPPARRRPATKSTASKDGDDF